MFIELANVETHIERKYPIIEAVEELFKKTETKKAIEIWHKPQAKKTINSISYPVLVKKLSLNITVPESQ